MSIELRVVLVIISVLMMLFMVKKIRKSKLQIEYSIFWIGFGFVIIIISIFPQIAYFLANFLHIQSPANFIFAFGGFILLVKVFLMTVEISQLENKVKSLVQEIALRDFEREKEEKEKNH